MRGTAGKPGGAEPVPRLAQRRAGEGCADQAPLHRPVPRRAGSQTALARVSEGIGAAQAAALANQPFVEKGAAQPFLKSVNPSQAALKLILALTRLAEAGTVSKRPYTPT